MMRVLMIAFIYPPLGGSGVQRTLKFSKYLPDFGWQPYIVCSDDPNVFGDGLDTTLLAEVPAEARVWRRPFVNPLGFRRRVQKLMGFKPHAEIAAQSTLALTGEEPAKTSLRRLFQALTSLLAPFEFPAVDAALYWALAIVPGCLRLIRQEKIDVIYTTSFPYSDHVAGWLLKKLSGKPWVADFRDPWTQHDVIRNTGWRYRVDRWVEQRVLHTADRVTGVTPSYTSDLHRLAPERSADHFVTIENGYDQADFNGVPESSHESGQQITLAHVGYLYNGTALPFFQALEALGTLGARLKVRFIGGLAPQETQWLENNCPSAEIKVEPRRSHAEAVQLMQEADVLLLFVIDGKPESGHYPGKLFEYLVSGTPILMVGPPGDAARLVERSGTGCFAPAGASSALLEILRLLVENPGEFHQRYFQPQPAVIAAYERKALTHKLTGIFDGLVGDTQP